MEQSVKQLWTNFAVGILGLFVGLDNLLRWIDDNSFTRRLITGVICLVLATIWIIYVFVKMKPTNDKFRLYLIIAIRFIILAGIILIMADGLRRWYSGGFFLIMGGVVLSKAIYEYRKTK